MTCLQVTKLGHEMHPLHNCGQGISKADACRLLRLLVVQVGNG